MSLRTVLPIVFLITLLGGMEISAQIEISRQVIASGAISSGLPSANKLRFSATIGQPISGTVGSTRPLTMGFQQPDIDGVVPVIELGNRSVEVKIFPNPVRRTLHVDLGEAARELSEIELYDPLGRLLMVRDLPDRQSLVTFQNLQNHPSGTYYLRAVDGHGLRYELGRVIFVTR